MRYIRYVFLAALAVVLVTVALANRDIVTLNLLPTDMASLSGIALSISVPLFFVFFLGVVLGIFVGFAWEWIRERKHRVAASGHKRENEKLSREVTKLKTDKAKNEGDEVLALLEN